MNNKNDIYHRWEKISKKSKTNYVFFKVPLLRIVPLMIMLIFIDELFMSYRYIDSGIFMILSILKIVLAYLLGIIIGKIEWFFIRRVAKGEYNQLSEIRKQYILIYGLLSFGLTITISNFSYPFESINLTMINLVLFPLGGILWGYMMWGAMGNGFNKYLKKL